jgi:electron transfer flavoprotein beta subunit
LASTGRKLKRRFKVNIIVLVKQVPDTESLLAVDTATATVDTENVKWIINPYDEYAIEEALRIKEKNGEGSVTALAVGPSRCESALRTALAMGADEAVLIDDPAVEGSDALSTARVLAAAAKAIPHDLIIAGMRAVDDDSYQVPAAVAEFLDMAQISFVVKQEIANGRITCDQLVDGGILVVDAALPVLLTTQRGLNDPRYASLPNIMKAKKKPLAKKTLADFGLAADQVGPACARVSIESLALPPERKAGRIIDADTPADKAAELVRLLKAEKTL